MTADEIQALQALYERTPFTRAECRWLLQQKERRQISDDVFETLVTAACVYGTGTVDRMFTAVAMSAETVSTRGQSTAPQIQRMLTIAEIRKETS